MACTHSTSLSDLGLDNTAAAARVVGNNGGNIIGNPIGNGFVHMSVSSAKGVQRCKVHHEGTMRAVACITTNCNMLRRDFEVSL